MRRSITVLVVVLALQLGLAALLAHRKNPLAASTPQTPLISASLDHIDQIVIEGQPTRGGAATTDSAPASTGATSARVELAKQKDGQWLVTNYFNAPADKFRLSSVLDELESLKRGLPVATSAEALKRFKLLDDNFDRRVTLRAGDKPVSTVYFGSSAGERQTDARTGTDHAVYNVQLADYELPTNPSDWLDADILQRDPDSVSALDIAGPATKLQLVRQQAPSGGSADSAQKATVKTGSATDNTSSPAKPAASAAASTASPAAAPKVWVDSSGGRPIDSARADALARNIAELHVEGILGLEALPAWQPEHPALTLQISDSKHPGEVATWTLYRPVSPPAAATTTAKPTHTGAASPPPTSSEPAYYVLKASAHPWYFKISSVTGKQLLDGSSLQQLVTSAGQPGKGAAHEKPEVGNAAHTRHRPPNRNPAAGA